MAIHDIKSDISIATGISATLSGVTPAAGNIVDTQGFGGVSFAFQTGVVTDAGTAAGFTIKLQESATTADADFTDVATGEHTGTLTVTSDTDDGVAVGQIGYVGIKRYVRCVVTGTTGTNAVITGIALLGFHDYAPGGVEANIAAT
jgi:hypothetical protein